MTLVFDLESNGLLNDVTRIHCIAIYDSTTDEIETYNDEKNNKYSITEGLNKLLVADTIVGHNIIGYDIPCISKLYNFFTPRCRVVDTLLLSRLYHPNLYELDVEKNYAGMELQHFGRHSLQAYGYRLGEHKGKFGQTSDWSEWSQEMEDYCVQDVEVTKKLCNYFLPFLTGSR